MKKGRGFSCGPVLISVTFVLSVFLIIVGLPHILFETRQAESQTPEIQITEMPICTAGEDQNYPAIYGDRIVWRDYRNKETSGRDIYMYDLSTGVETPICTAAQDQLYPAIYGDKIVWEDYRRGASDIYMYDLSTGTETPICAAPRDQGFSSIYGDKIVWQDYRNGEQSGFDIYMYDLSTGTETPICTALGDQWYPAIYGEKIVWEDYRNRTTSGIDIYMYDLSTGTETQICSAPRDQRHPDIYRNKIVWVDVGTRIGINVYDLSTGTETSVCTTTGAGWPVIYGNKVVWNDYRNWRTNGYDIYMYDLSRGVETPICTARGDQWRSAIYENRIAWIDERNKEASGTDIYMAVVGTIPVPPPKFEPPPKIEWHNPYQDGDQPLNFGAQKRVQMHAHYYSDVIGGLSEADVIQKYMDSGYDFVFITEHDPLTVYPLWWQKLEGLNIIPKNSSQYTYSSESTQDHHLLTYGTFFAIQESSLYNQLKAAYADVDIFPGDLPYCAAAHPHSFKNPWSFSDLKQGSVLSQEWGDGAFGMEIYNEDVHNQRVLVSCGVWLDARHDWDDLLSIRTSRNVTAIAGDDYHPSELQKKSFARTSVMVVGLSEPSPRPCFSDSTEWYSYSKKVMDELKAKHFYLCRGEPIRFNKIRVENDVLKVGLDEPADIVFVGEYGAILGTASNTTEASFNLRERNWYYGGYVRVEAYKDSYERFSMSQPIIIEGQYKIGGGVSGTNMPDTDKNLSSLSDPEPVQETINIYKASLIVPTQQSEITVNAQNRWSDEYPEAEPPQGYFSEIYDFAPSDTPLNPQGTLAISYDPSRAQYYGAQNLRIFRYDPEESAWIALPSTVNEEEKQVTANIDRLGTYALSAITIDDSEPPDVNFFTPATLDGSETILAFADDNVGVYKVSFFLDDIFLGSDFSSDYGTFETTFDFSKIAQGEHTLRVRAEDIAGNAKEATKTVTVQSTVANPTIEITSPSVASSVQGKLGVSGTCSPNAEKVMVLLDGQPIANLAPENGNWGFEEGFWPSGSHTITAFAIDSVGNKGEATIMVFGLPQDETPPTVDNVTYPSSVQDNSPIVIAAKVSDNNAVSSLTLHYKFSASEPYFHVYPFKPMQTESEYEAELPQYYLEGQHAIFFFISAADPDGNFACYPEGAPDTALCSVAIVSGSTTPLVADVGGPYAGDEGSPISFDGTKSYDPDGAIVAYEWDLDGDGEYDDAVGPNPTWTWNDDYSGNIGLRVTDNDSLTDTDTTTVTVNNVAPTANANAGAPYEGIAGMPIALEGSAADPGADTLTYAWDLDGDGDYDDSTEQNPVWIWNTPGYYLRLGLKVTDDDGGVSTDVTMASISPLPSSLLPPHLLISEVFYDTPGIDSEEEWIEIYNPTASKVDISNYKISDKNTNIHPEGVFRFPDGTQIEPGAKIVMAQTAAGFHALYGKNPDFELVDTKPHVPDMIGQSTGGYFVAKIDLQDDGDEVLLLDENNYPVDAMTYEMGLYPGIIPHLGVLTGHSLERFPKDNDTDDCNIDFRDQVTPDPETVNDPPVARVSGPYMVFEGEAVLLSSAGTEDSDDDALTYDWDFGDGTPHGEGVSPTHTYAVNGTYRTYTVTLIVSDGNSNSSPATTQVDIYVRGDINQSGEVNIFDLVIVSKAFGSKQGDSDWNPKADINFDNQVNIFDLVLVAKDFNKSK